MGIMLGLAMAAGVLIGQLITVLLASIAFIVTRKTAKRRSYVWWAFAAAIVVFLPLLIMAIQYYPYESMRPGSDYDIAMKNFFIAALYYSASPGIAAIIATLLAMFCPKKPQPQS